MPQWFEDESFWEELYPFIFSDEKFATAVTEIEQALKLVSCTSGRALDLCCGPGRHAIPLAERGFQVTGVDRSRFLLDKAQERARTAGVDVEFVLEDMRRFVRPALFDVVFSIFTSFGYFDDKAEDLGVVRNVHDSLKPGGVFLLEMMSKERLVKTFQSTVSTRAPDGSLVVQRHEIVDDWTRVKNEWIYVKMDKTVSWNFHVRVYSGQEARDLLARGGFSSVKLYGGLDGRSCGLDVDRLVAVATKSHESLTT
jgi:SAM-dependent methyltransferase